MEEVKSGKYFGWDDPRTWSIQSIIKRGILPQAFKDFVISIGLNKQDITVPIDALYAINRSLIDKSTDRYYFVENPVELKVKNHPPELQSVGIPIHPDKDETRIVHLKSLFISKEDVSQLFGQEIRLLHLYNIKLSSELKKDSISSEYLSSENKKIPKIQWVSSSVPARILMPSGEWSEGIAESDIKNLKKNQIIQFERFGFVKFQGKSRQKDKSGKSKEFYDFWFGHK